MEIVYKVYNNLYVNLTNRCPCACTFCLRKGTDRVGESGRLWLEREPVFEEVLEAFVRYEDTTCPENPLHAYKEIVFCGFGEPTEALALMLRLAAALKEKYKKPLRINTNGLGNLIWGRDITPELTGLFDTVSISLNTPNPARYLELVRPKFGEGSFEAMLDFAKAAAKAVPRVILTTVATTLSAEEEAQCAEICRNLGVEYRIRSFE